MKKILALVLLCSSLLVAQTQPPPPQTETPRAPTPEQPPVSGPWKAETKISPQEAQELFRSVDEILKFASEDTGLPIKHPVKRELASREQVQKFIEDRMRDDEDAKRLARSEIVLKKLGLLPRDFDLRAFLVDLLKEQVAGFYDSKKKTVFLLDWVDPDSQKPVLAHELTHALQDQNYDIEKWTKAEKSRSDDVSHDEALTARQAVLEGQGMVVLIDYMLAPQGGSLLEMPNLADAIAETMAAGPGMAVYNRAPLFIQQVLLFPYRYGLHFERDLLVNGGREKAFAGVLKNPPRDSRQVMQPATYLAGQFVEPLRPPDFGIVVPGYKKYDIGAMGEFDVSVLLSQYAAEPAKALPSQWRGGYYWTAKAPQIKGKEKNKNKVDVADTSDTASIALIYVSRWASAEAASQFAAAYAAGLPKRYRNVEKLTMASAQSGRITAGGSDGAAQEVPENETAALTEPTTFITEEGPVIIVPQGDMLLITESFDADTARRIRETVLKGSDH